MVARSWGRAISGPILALIGLALLAIQQTVANAPTLAKIAKYGSWTTLAIAVLLVLVAQYEVWRDADGARRKAETELNSEADLRGVVRASILQYNPLADQSQPGSGLQYSIEVANHGRKACEVSRICFILEGPAPDDMKRIEEPLFPDQVRTVRYGQQFRASGSFTIRGLKTSRLNRSKVTIRLLDSLGTEYQNIATEILSRVESDSLGTKAESAPRLDE